MLDRTHDRGQTMNDGAINDALWAASRWIEQRGQSRTTDHTALMLRMMAQTA